MDVCVFWAYILLTYFLHTSFELSLCMLYNRKKCAFVCAKWQHVMFKLSLFQKCLLCLMSFSRFGLTGVTPPAALGSWSYSDCHFTHPDLKLLCVGLSRPVVPTHTPSHAFARVTVYPSPVSFIIASFGKYFRKQVLGVFYSQFCLFYITLNPLDLFGIAHDLIWLDNGLIIRS